MSIAFCISILCTCPSLSIILFDEMDDSELPFAFVISAELLFL